MQPRREVLREYDYSVRVNLASSAICGGAQEPTVALKLHLTQADSNSERQVRCVASRALGLMMDTCEELKRSLLLMRPLMRVLCS